MIFTTIVLLIILGFMAFVIVGGMLYERFWNWYNDSAWDAQGGDDRPEHDDFPGPK